MGPQKHVSTPWILLALCTGVILFCTLIVASEIKKYQETYRASTVLPDRFKEMEAGDLSTPLNTRYEALGPDTYCLNELQLSSTSPMQDWQAIRSFLENHFHETAGELELRLRTTLTEMPTSTILSTCYFGEELYALREAGSGEEFAGYDIMRVRGAEPIEAADTFILPLGRRLSMRTDLFKEEVLGVSARTGDESHTSWYYFTFNPVDGRLTQVEWCDRWFGGGFSPYGDEPTLNCEYMYTF